MFKFSGVHTLSYVSDLYRTGITEYGSFGHIDEIFGCIDDLEIRQYYTALAILMIWKLESMTLFWAY